ncbi:MAG: hypothetical protein QXI86_07180 [Ignisphaera sp.]
MSIKPAKILRIDRIAENTYLLAVELFTHMDNISPFNFFMVWVPRVDEIPLSVAFLDNNIIYFLFKVKGLGTETLSKMCKGEIVGLKGPLGRGFIVEDYTKSVLVIAGGIGIAPIPFFIYRSKYKKLDVVWGVKRREELFNLNIFNQDIGDRYRLFMATEDCSYGFCGTALERLKNIPLEDYDIILAVGPQPMLKGVCEYIRNTNLEAYVALETMVKCGIGLCGSCFIRSSNKLLCIDGPVFRCDEVIQHLGKTNNSKNI